MKRFDKVKTLQLILFALLTVGALFAILRDAELYHTIAVDPHVRLLCILLWVVLGLSFLFLFYDFSTYTGIKREYSELDFAVYSDPLTGVANRYSCDAFIERYLDKPLPREIGCITFDMTNLQEINRINGHLGGNNAIREFSSILQSCADRDVFVGRNGGNKFLAVFQSCSQEKLQNYLDAVRKKMDRHNANSGTVEILYRYGIAFDESSDEIKTITELIALSNRRAAIS